MTMKAHIIRPLPCGCKEAVWLFGREIVEINRRCTEHAHGPYKRGYSWSEKR